MGALKIFFRCDNNIKLDMFTPHYFFRIGIILFFEIFLIKRL